MVRIPPEAFLSLKFVKLFFLYYFPFVFPYYFTRNVGNLVKVPIIRTDYNNLNEVSINSDRVSGGKSVKGNERAVPNLMLSNARSLANKGNELEILKESYRADLIFVTETC